MGWYTSGPGGLDYKYGDVRAFAEVCPFGTTSLIPRVAATTGDGERLYGVLEFLGPLQRVVEEAGLPWHHFDFDLDVGPSGESMVVSRDRRAASDGVRLDLGLERRLELLALRVGEHAESIREVLGRAARDGMAMFLRDWRYAPPPPLDLLFEDRWRDRSPLHLGLEALAWAVLSGDRFRLAQPDDEYTMVAWRAQDVGPTDPA